MTAQNYKKSALFILNLKLTSSPGKSNYAQPISATK